MTFEELLKELKQFENTDEYKNFISGLINDDRVTAYLDTDSGKKLMQPKLDSYFSKGLETWKTNNLDKLVNEKVKELYPGDNRAKKAENAIYSVITKKSALTKAIINNYTPETFYKLNDADKKTIVMALICLRFLSLSLAPTLSLLVAIIVTGI